MRSPTVFLGRLSHTPPPRRDPVRLSIARDPTRTRQSYLSWKVRRESDFAEPRLSSVIGSIVDVLLACGAEHVLYRRSRSGTSLLSPHDMVADVVYDVLDFRIAHSPLEDRKIAGSIRPSPS